ncbi:MAG: hypothetical protein QG622_3279 [Actinomycetota bacterium]|nr:hypothetical protein [Actinomycetota bacterium]
MSSSGSPAPQPRALTFHARRSVVAFAAVVALPLSLTACGLLGGNKEDEAPVVIPGEAVDESVNSSSPAPSLPPQAAASPVQVTVTAEAAAAAPGETVVKTGVVVQKSTQYLMRTRTATSVAIVTLPRATVVQTPLGGTVTDVRTATKMSTITRTGDPTTITVTVRVPGGTATGQNGGAGGQ